MTSKEGGFDVSKNGSPSLSVGANVFVPGAIRGSFLLWIHSVCSVDPANFLVLLSFEIHRFDILIEMDSFDNRILWLPFSRDLTSFPGRPASGSAGAGSAPSPSAGRGFIPSAAPFFPGGNFQGEDFAHGPTRVHPHFSPIGGLASRRLLLALKRNIHLISIRRSTIVCPQMVWWPSPTVCSATAILCSIPISFTFSPPPPGCPRAIRFLLPCPHPGGSGPRRTHALPSSPGSIDEPPNDASPADWTSRLLTHLCTLCPPSPHPVPRGKVRNLSNTYLTILLRRSLHSFFMSESLRQQINKRNTIILRGTSLDGSTPFTLKLPRFS